MSDNKGLADEQAYTISVLLLASYNHNNSLEFFKFSNTKKHFRTKQLKKIVEDRPGVRKRKELPAREIEELLHSRPTLLLVAPINAEAGDGDADTKRWWLSAVEWRRTGGCGVWLSLGKRM